MVNETLGLFISNSMGVIGIKLYWFSYGFSSDILFSNSMGVI